MMIIK